MDVNMQAGPPPGMPPGTTLLHWASSAPAVWTLLVMGSRPDPQDSLGRTPLHYACERGHYVKVGLLVVATIGWRVLGWLGPLMEGVTDVAVVGFVLAIICAALVGAILPFELLTWWCMRLRRLLPTLVSEKKGACMGLP